MVPSHDLGELVAGAAGEVVQEHVAGRPVHIRTRSHIVISVPMNLRAVLAVIYLIFSEGYTASSGDRLIREDLCTGAIRLGRLLAELMPDEPEVLVRPSSANACAGTSGAILGVRRVVAVGEHRHHLLQDVADLRGSAMLFTQELAVYGIAVGLPAHPNCAEDEEPDDRHLLPYSILITALAGNVYGER